jgi:hypothetical protein
MGRSGVTRGVIVSHHYAMGAWILNLGLGRGKVGIKEPDKRNQRPSRRDDGNKELHLDFSWVSDTNPQVQVPC